jgi:hypothetical protein
LEQKNGGDGEEVNFGWSRKARVATARPRAAREVAPANVGCLSVRLQR